jgi:hypothetical protein
MRQYRLWGSVRGVLGNRHPYRDHWTERGAHLLLQVRAQVMNGDLRKVFGRWYPGMKARSEEPVRLVA